MCGRAAEKAATAAATVYCGVVRSQSPGNDAAAAANRAYTPAPIPSG